MAAVALLLGMDPLTYLARSGHERVITDVVLRRAYELRVEEMQARAGLPTG